MTFPLEFDLLMIGVCTFIKTKTKKNKKKQKKTKKKRKKKETKKKQKKEKKKQKKTKTKKKQKRKMQRYVCVSYLTPSFFFFVCCWVHQWGFEWDFSER